MAALPFWPSLGTVAPQHTRVANGQWYPGEGRRWVGPGGWALGNDGCFRVLRVLRSKAEVLISLCCAPARAGSCFSNPKSVSQRSLKLEVLERNQLRQELCKKSRCLLSVFLTSGPPHSFPNPVST